MEVEKSWSDVCLYSVSFKKKNEEIKRKIYRSVAVTATGESAFCNNLLKNVMIPNSVTSIGNYAFV